MNRQVFYDPQRKRWKRLRIVFDVLALLGLVVGILFLAGLMRMKPLPELLLRNTPKRNYRALATPPVPAVKPGTPLKPLFPVSTSRKPDCAAFRVASW